MWKYVTRRIRDTFERTANHFEKRSGAGVVNSTSNFEEKNNRPTQPCRWYAPRGCWNFQENTNDTNSNRWNFDCLNRTWIGAITWSSALVIGWYASQILHLKCKYQRIDQHKKYQSVHAIFQTLQPYVNNVHTNPLCFKTASKAEEVVDNFTPTTIHLISNEHKESTGSASSGLNTTPENSDDALGNVLNSIENKLGLAAIENGQHQDGLSLLRSAANRQHPPALYNLGLCYEMGLGVKIDEKTAMELYRSAAALQHPGALYNLGIYYGQGRGGLQRDIDTATRLLRLAAVQGQQDAINALKALDVEDITPPYNDLNQWTGHFSTLMQKDNIIPIPSTVFVENINYLQSKITNTAVY